MNKKNANTPGQMRNQFPAMRFLLTKEIVNTVAAPLIRNIRGLCRDEWRSFSGYDAAEYLREQYIQVSEIIDLDAQRQVIRQHGRELQLCIIERERWWPGEMGSNVISIRSMTTGSWTGIHGVKRK